MANIDREKLQTYLQTVITHKDNPESFRYQMQAQIAKTLKVQEHNLKKAQSKIRFNQLLESQQEKRQKLKKELQQKAKKGIQHKQKLISERTKSLVQLHQRRQMMQRQKVKENRKQQLLKSLKKIQQFQSKKQAAQQFKLNKSLSQSGLRSASKYSLREEAQHNQYNAIVEKLQHKGLFTLPSKELQAIYSHKALYSNQSEKKLKKMQQKLGQSLSRIEQARHRKEALLIQRSQKIQVQQRLQYEVKMSKWKQLEAEENKKRKELQIKQAKKILKGNVVNGVEIERSARTENDQVVQVELGAQKIKVKNPSYRQQIRKHIDNFLKGKALQPDNP